jgi:hypothetical protein
MALFVNYFPIWKLISLMETYSESRRLWTTKLVMAANFAKDHMALYDILKWNEAADYGGTHNFDSYCRWCWTLSLCLPVCLPLCFLIYCYMLWYLAGLVVVCLEPETSWRWINDAVLKDVLPTANFVIMGIFTTFMGEMSKSLQNIPTSCNAMVTFTVV